MPYGYRVQAIHGFVEELVVNDDPEYQWIDKIRSQRASNEARQILFSKLSGWSISFDRKKDVLDFGCVISVLFRRATVFSLGLYSNGQD